MSQYDPEVVESIPVVIAAAGSLSAGVNLRGKRCVAVQMPAAWTSAVLTFQASADGVTYSNVYTYGVEYTETVVASGWHVIDPNILAGAAFIKIRSGTAATPVAQAAERTIGVISREV